MYKATGGDLSRSLCSLVCKWTYQKDGWNDDFFNRVGLGDLVGYSRLGTRVRNPGHPIGTVPEGLAAEIGLKPDSPCYVASSMIDAHAGALRMLACNPDPSISAISVDERLGMICGTSNCHMALSPNPVRVAGVWGPYYSAVLPEMWLLEGGQTAVGSLIDHLLEGHLAYDEAALLAERNGVPVQQYLEGLLLGDEEEATRHLHVYPDFHGNRSPLSDPRMKGAVCGLSLENDVASLAKLYAAAVQATAYGTRHIVDEMRVQGRLNVKAASICGGFAQSDFFVQTYADALRIPVVKPRDAELCVSLGAAALGMAAASAGKPLIEVLGSIVADGKVFYPRRSNEEFHEKKYSVFRSMAEDQIKYRKLMT